MYEVAHVVLKTKIKKHGNQKNGQTSVKKAMLRERGTESLTERKTVKGIMAKALEESLQTLSVTDRKTTINIIRMNILYIARK